MFVEPAAVGVKIDDRLQQVEFGGSSQEVALLVDADPFAGEGNCIGQIVIEVDLFHVKIILRGDYGHKIFHGHLGV